MNEIDNYENENRLTDNEVFFKFEDYGDKYFILCRLPGARKEEISINYDNDNLRIGLPIRRKAENSGVGFYISFTETTFINKDFYVPNANVSLIKGNFDGLNLTVELPKNVTVENDNTEFVEVENFEEI